MKTIMNKTASAVTALMTIAVLMAAVAVLSCKPEVEITKRDWKAVHADKDPAQSEIGSDATKPAITAVLNKDTSVANHNVVTIVFPDNADILQKKNTEIAGAMQKFLKFYPYTKSSDTTIRDSLDPAIGYQLVSKDKSTIKIALNSVPDDKNVVAHLIASEYTYASGRKLGAKGDTEYGTPYYDRYTTLPVTGATPSPAGNYAPQYKDWTLTISGISSTAVPDSSGSLTVTVANFSTNVTSDTWREDILNQLKSKFKLRQFKDGKWSDVTTRTFEITGALDLKHIDLIFTPEEFIPYVVEVSGLKNLKTTGRYWDVNQRVKVAVGTDPGVFNLEKVTTEPYQWFNANPTPARTLVTGSTTPSVISSSEYIGDDKSLIVKLTFNPITAPGGGGNAYLKNMSLGEFKKYFKIGYRIDGTKLTEEDQAEFFSAEKIAFLGINEVKYGSSLTPAENLNQITLTFSSGYTRNSFAELYVFIAKGFEYTDGNIIFGNYKSWDYTVDGVRYFDYYGKLSIEGGFKHRTPSES